MTNLQKLFFFHSGVWLSRFFTCFHRLTQLVLNHWAHLTIQTRKRRIRIDSSSASIFINTSKKGPKTFRHWHLSNGASDWNSSARFSHESAKNVLNITQQRFKKRGLTLASGTPINLGVDTNYYSIVVWFVSTINNHPTIQQSNNLQTTHKQPTIPIHLL